MKTIKNKTNGITINGVGINSNSNSIDYMINIPITDIEYAIGVCPFINGQATLYEGKFIYGSNKHIPNLPEIMSSNYILESDLGLSGAEITKNFSTAILFNTNALGFDENDWELVNE